MNRTERLLTLLQILRRYRKPVSGQKLADELNISIRTLYRDIVTLQLQGADIEGEPGVGYILRPGFFFTTIDVLANRDGSTDAWDSVGVYICRSSVGQGSF